MNSTKLEWLQDEIDITQSFIRSTPSSNITNPQVSNSYEADTALLNYLLDTAQQPINDMPTNSHDMQKDYLNHNNNLAMLNQSIHSTGSISERQPKVQSSQFNPDNLPFPISILEEKDNFVTIAPICSTQPTNKRKVNKKTKTQFKESIFISASPHNSTKIMKYPGNPRHDNSSEENSDNDDGLKSEKEKSYRENKQYRNKISARNFRLRRKEFINTLQEKVKEQEKIIEALQKENSELRKANEQLRQNTGQFTTSSPVSNNAQSSEFSISSSESEDGVYSTSQEQSDFSPMEFQLSDLYDFSLLNMVQQQEPQWPLDPSTSNLFYLNHASIPEFNIKNILNESEAQKTPEKDVIDEEPSSSKRLLQDYPLLASGLMSVIVHHTLSINYVADLANRFKSEIQNDPLYQKNNPSKVIEDTIKALGRLQLKDSPKTDLQEEKLKEESKYKVLLDILEHHFTNYCILRAAGKTHDEIIKHAIHCKTATRKKEQAKQEKKKIKEMKKAEKSQLEALQEISRVAGHLLKTRQLPTPNLSALKCRFKKENFNTPYMGKGLNIAMNIARS